MIVHATLACSWLVVLECCLAISMLSAHSITAADVMLHAVMWSLEERHTSGEALAAQCKS